LKTFKNIQKRANFRVETFKNIQKYSNFLQVHAHLIDFCGKAKINQKYEARNSKSEIQNGSTSSPQANSNVQSTKFPSSEVELLRRAGRTGPSMLRKKS
jgi:hypothetical protein